MKSNYKLYEKNINGDIWQIYLTRYDKLVKITCDLMRPNRKFYQSKILYSDYTCCNGENINSWEELANDVIDNYYHQQEIKNKIDEFFEKPIDK